MEETKYHIEADKELARLTEHLERLEEKYGVSVELEQGVLSLIMPDDREYIINKHAPSQQIWVSSPYSGAGYFEWREDKWLPKRSEAANGRELFEFIKEEVALRAI